MFTSVRAWALGCFHSLISTQTFRRALTASVPGQLRGDKECPFSGRSQIWQSLEEVPESGAWSVGPWHTPSLSGTFLQNLMRKDVVNQCLGFGSVGAGH